MSEQANTQAVRRLWESFEAREWEQAGEQLHDSFVADWPHTGERIRGRENFLAVNRNYPPTGWRTRVLRLVAAGDNVAAEVAVPHDTGISYAAAFYEMRDGRITHATEYWVEAGAEAAPAWRRQWVEQPEAPATGDRPPEDTQAAPATPGGSAP